MKNLLFLSNDEITFDLFKSIYANPLPSNSSSIFNTHVITSGFLTIKTEKVFKNSP